MRLASEGIEEGDQVLLLFRRQPHLKALVVEVHELGEVCGRAIVEVGRTRGEAAQDRALAAVEVAALSGDQRLARIGGVEGLRLPGAEGVGAAADQVYRHVGERQLR